MMINICGRYHARKLKFSNYVHMPSINTIFLISLRLSDTVRCSRGSYFEHGCYVSALAHIWMLILSIYVLLECTNTIYKYGQAWVIK